MVGSFIYVLAQLNHVSLSSDVVLLSNSNVAFTKFQAYSKILGVVAIQQIQITYCDCDQAFSVYSMLCAIAV